VLNSFRKKQKEQKLRKKQKRAGKGRRPANNYPSLLNSFAFSQFLLFLLFCRKDGSPRGRVGVPPTTRNRYPVLNSFDFSAFF